MSRGADYGKSPSWYAWRRLRRNRAAFISLLFIGLCFLISVSGYLFLPDKSPDANRQNIELETLPPGSKVTILRIPKEKLPEGRGILKSILFGAPDKYTELPIQSYLFKDNFLYFKRFGNEDAAFDSIWLPRFLGILPAKNDVPDSLKQFLIRTEKLEPVERLQKKIEQEFIVHRTYILGTDRFGRDMLS